MPTLATATRRQIELAVSTSGRPVVDELKRSLDTVNASIEVQRQRFASGTQNLDQFRAATTKLIAEQARLSAEFEHANTYLTRGAGMSSEALRKTTAAAIQFSYAVDDVKYGMGALMNNIAPMLAPLGLVGAGLSIAAVASKALYDNWRTLTAAFRPDLIANTADATGKLKKEIEELGKQTHSTTGELKELANAKEALAAKQAEEKLFAGGTDRQADIKNAFKKIQDEGKAGVLQGAAHEAAMRQFLDDPMKALKDAVREGMLKDANGKPVTKIDPRRIALNPQHLVDLKTQWLDSVLPVIRGSLVKRLSEGDSAAVGEVDAKVRKSGNHETGPIRDVLTDLTNAQSGLPSQKELEAAGRKNARDGDKKRREERQEEWEKDVDATNDIIESDDREEASEREKSANHIASVYATKLREATEKTIASGVLARMADKDVQANLQAGFARRMKDGGVNAVDIPEAARKAAREAMTSANAKIMAMGNTRPEGAAALMAAAGAKAEKADDNSPENKRLDEIAKHFGGGAKDDFLERMMIENRQRREALNRLPRDERRAMMAEANVQRQMEEDNAKMIRSGLSPADRRKFDLQRKLNTFPVAPLSDEGMAGLLADRQARAMLAGGATDADGKPITEADARAAGKRVVDQAARSVNDRYAGGLARTGSPDMADAEAAAGVAPKPQGRGMHSVGLGPAANAGQVDPLASLATVAGRSLQATARTQSETLASVKHLGAMFDANARFQDALIRSLSRMSNARTGAPRGRQR